MLHRHDHYESRTLQVPLIASSIGIAVLAVALARIAPPLLPVLAVPAIASLVMARRLRNGEGLQIEEIELLRKAELALASASDTEVAARELADHAIALLGARSAVVIIEGIGDTVRVTSGEASIYRDGSRMRLLDDDGMPCGSIAVSAREDGKPYGPRHETILDALAQRVSSTLHRLSLYNEAQAERRTLADVVESSSDGIFSVGDDLKVRFWSPAMARITGVHTTDAVGESVASVFKPVDEDGEPRYGTGDPGRTASTESLLVKIASTEGEERWITCSYSPLPEGGYVVVARDDTERKKLQDDKDGWVAQVSHELRTPLTPIKGFLHTLQRRDSEFTTEDRHRIYEVMLREEQRLEDLVNSLLQSTTLDAPGSVVVPEVLDWARIVAEQVDLFGRQDLTRAIEVSCADDLPTVIADANLATGVLSNLLSNALKYSPEGSPVQVSLSREGDHVVTTVSDSGPGVPPGDRERVFEKFTRLGDHLTRPQQGVGLGLYIARRSVQRMEGEMWIASVPGGGAAFSFTLPVHERSRPKRNRREQLRA
jgi:PAS domain S-box-containing protein